MTPESELRASAWVRDPQPPKASRLYVPEPGTELGPCNEASDGDACTCPGEDGKTRCAEARAAAEAPCFKCAAAIGYGVEFYAPEGARVHAGCAGTDDWAELLELKTEERK